MIWILRKKHEYVSQGGKTLLEALCKHTTKLNKAHSYAPLNIFNTKSSREAVIAKFDSRVARLKRVGLSALINL